MRLESKVKLTANDGAKQKCLSRREGLASKLSPSLTHKPEFWNSKDEGRGPIPKFSYNL